MKKKLSTLLALVMLGSMVAVCLCGFAPRKGKDDKYEYDPNRLYGEAVHEETFIYDYETDFPTTWRTVKLKTEAPDYVSYGNGAGVSSFCGPIGGAQIMSMSDYYNGNAWPNYQSWTGDYNNPTMKGLDNNSSAMIHDLGNRMGINSGGYVTMEGFWNGMDNQALTVGMPLTRRDLATKTMQTYRDIEAALLAGLPVVMFMYYFELLEDWYVDQYKLEWRSSVYRGGHIVVIDSIDYVYSEYLSMPIDEVWLGVKSDITSTRKTYVRGVWRVYLDGAAGVKVG